MNIERIEHGTLEDGGAIYVYKLTNANGGTWSVETRDMAPKLAAGTNASVSYSSGTYTVSATDTTYSAFTGTDGQTAGTSGLVPAPATTDAGKFLKADGTWDTAGGGGSAGTIFYITDTKNSDVPGYSAYYFPQYFRVFKDSAYTDEIGVSDIMNALKNGPANVVIHSAMSPQMDYPGQIVSSYGSGGAGYFYMFAQYEYSQAYSKIFRCTTLMNIPGSSTTYLWQSTNQDAMPSIPTVNNGTLTIQQNGTTLGTFTANQSSASTINISSATIDAIYPVGSIYMSATMNTVAQVEAAFGGTWVAWGAGKVPVGVDTGDTDFDTAEETGGAKTHSHGLSGGYAKLNIRSNGQIPYREKSVASWTSNYRSNANSGTSDSQSSSYGIELGGSSDSGSTMPPYITCYMYKRTA